MRILLCWARLLGWAVLATGLVFQVFLRDRWDGWALLFYGLPKPLLGTTALVLAWMTRGRPRRLAGVLSAGLWIWWVTSSWCWNPAPEPAATRAQNEVRLLSWNLSRPQVVHADLVALIRDFQPDAVVGIEPGPRAGELLRAYEAELPGYRADFMPRGILWLSRVPSRYRERGKLDGLGAFALFDVNHPQSLFSIVAVDVYAHPLISRRKQIEEALAHTRGRSDVILMGDFNTPLESVHFAPFRNRGLTNAFEAGGRGFRETWFWGLPLLSLDQVWVGDAWQVVATQKVQKRSSDHAALLVTLKRR